MKEIWKAIEGYEGYYEISSMGRIKSLEKRVKHGNSTRYIKEKIKEYSISPSGYPVVSLSKNGICRAFQVHVLMAKAFIPNPEKKEQVDHINTDKTDFRLDNLRWVTPKENSNNILTLQHCKENTYSKESLKKRLETRKERKTVTSPKTVFQYTKDGVFVKEYYSIHEAEVETGVKHNSINRALNDNTQSAGGFLWTDIKSYCGAYQRRQHPKSKPIMQYDKDGNFIKEWPSILEAAKSLRLHPANIARNIKSNSTPRKYKFKYKEDE